MTIRAFRKQHEFCQENVKRVNANLRMDFHNNGSNEWLGFRLELLGSFTFCVATLFMILLPSSIIKPGKLYIYVDTYFCLAQPSIVINKIITLTAKPA